MPRASSPNFMAGVPELIILRLLQDREMYGYELVQAIRTETGDAMSLGEGVVYTVLHTLEREGALRSRRKSVEGRSRIYYTPTAVGLKRYGALARSWTSLADTIRAVIEGPRHAAII
ncbi:MAG TPA: PadR family transcriptional regulator [Steroidobacteraceae bacterium]|nr:PadR family transcriptional regulator [Steroidobacteraceae bacterium]